MSIKFNVKITENDIVNFQLYHSRTHTVGIVSLVAILGCLGLSVWNATMMNISDAMMFVVCAGILYFFPRQQLKAKAKRQVKNSEMFQKELEYEFNETGFITRQGDLEVPNEWLGVEKVVSTKRSVIIYMSRVRAIIFPKRCIGEHYEDLLTLIRENVPKDKVKIK